LDIRRVGVIGAGVMGQGVAQSLAHSGHQVVLIDVGQEVLDQAKERIIQSSRMQNLFSKTDNRKDLNDTLGLITFSDDYNLLKKVDYVVENVTEKWDIKKQLYLILESVCAMHCIFAANTSAISITRIGSITKRPQKVIGTHFMNPVPMKKMVEVIRGYHTSKETVDITKKILKQMGNDCIVVEDSPGFVSNRVLMLTINEAIHLVQDRVAGTEDIDKIFKTCFEHKMGPLETADLIGLDTILYSLEVLYESFNDQKFRPCPLLKKMVEAGLHGRKNGKGFYAYE
jgi:3-hydroxybutyryl-CoA dehydrogenase